MPKYTKLITGYLKNSNADSELTERYLRLDVSGYQKTVTPVPPQTTAAPTTASTTEAPTTGTTASPSTGTTASPSTGTTPSPAQTIPVRILSNYFLEGEPGTDVSLNVGVKRNAWFIDGQIRITIKGTHPVTQQVNTLATLTMEMESYSSEDAVFSANFTLRIPSDTSPGQYMYLSYTVEPYMSYLNWNSFSGFLPTSSNEQLYVSIVPPTTLPPEPEEYYLVEFRSNKTEVSFQVGGSGTYTAGSTAAFLSGTYNYTASGPNLASKSGTFVVNDIPIIVSVDLFYSDGIPTGATVCDGYNKREVVHDGQGGTRPGNVSQYNSPSCGYYELPAMQYYNFNAPSINVGAGSGEKTYTFTMTQGQPGQEFRVFWFETFGHNYNNFLSQAYTIFTGWPPVGNGQRAMGYDDRPLRDGHGNEYVTLSYGQTITIKVSGNADSGWGYIKMRGYWVPAAWPKPISPYNNTTVPKKGSVISKKFISHRSCSSQGLEGPGFDTYDYTKADGLGGTYVERGTEGEGCY